MRRLIVMVTFFILAYGLVGMISESFMSNTEIGRDRNQFQIVDKYKNCDVVRYGQFFLTYKYFFHCSTPQ